MVTEHTNSRELSLEWTNLVHKWKGGSCSLVSDFPLLLVYKLTTMDEDCALCVAYMCHIHHTTGRSSHHCVEDVR